MLRRTFLQTGLIATCSSPLYAALQLDQLQAAVEVLKRANLSGQVESAAVYVEQGNSSVSHHFGKAPDKHAKFLLGSISKPIAITALMTLYDQRKFQLDDRVEKFLPQFTGDGRERVTIQHLLTHTSGLPDQLPENDTLRKSHAPLATFVERTLRTPLSFAAGVKYQYSSMAILLATHIAERISGTDILTLVDRAVLQPLEMKHSAQGVGPFQLSDLVRMQTEHAAPESGGGDPQAKEWDWNSPYWRKLGAPWGGTHASAGDVAKFLREFLLESGRVVRPETARLMATNRNPTGLTSRGLGLNVGATWASPGCSERTFGHTGSTGTIAWADPATQTICVVLTSLPHRAVTPHPRDLAAGLVAKAMQ